MTIKERVYPGQGFLNPEIIGIIDASQHEYDQMWQTVNFCLNFPGLVQQLISPLKALQFSPMQREAVLRKTLTSFVHLSWDDKAENSIPVTRLIFTRDGTIARRGGEELGNQADPLMQAEIACALLLGMSLPNQDIVKTSIANLYTGLTEMRKDGFKYYLGRLADIKNASRAWVKGSGLDRQTSFEWDSWIVGLRLGLPGYSIDRAKDKPIPDIPQECTFVLKERFSKEAVTVFLQYLWRYSQTFPLTDEKCRIIVDFMHDLSHFGPDFLYSEPILPIFRDLRKLINSHYNLPDIELA